MTTRATPPIVAAAALSLVTCPANTGGEPTASDTAGSSGDDATVTLRGVDQKGPR